MFFKANSACDNRAYALSAELKCPNAGEIYHESFAHLFPSNMFADKLSNIMLRAGLRPKREGFDGDTKIFNDIEELFADNLNNMEDIKRYILMTIESLDYEIENKEFVIELENMLIDISKLLKMSDVWYDKAKMYKDNVKKFDLDFEDFLEFMEK